MPSIERVVFLSLVLDLFAFTIPLPLFPRLIDWYTKREYSANGFLNKTLGFVTGVRSLFFSPADNPQRWDVVLLGGLMGSLFSTLQFIVSPLIGSLSDKYGRKKILLLTMIGNILSAAVWVKSTTFATYMLSRAIGGLSEGNVQLAIAILSDITTPENRSKALAHVGIAFAICFCIGPPIGAYFASRPVALPFFSGFDLNVYAAPALLTLILLVAETIFLMVALPETRGKAAQSTKKVANAKETSNGHANGHVKVQSAPSNRAATVEGRLSILSKLKTLHFLFLGLFSGVEFTLTFLTFDLFDWNNSQNGMLIGSIGIMSALLQGGYVRRSTGKVGEGRMAQRGVVSCTLALVLLSIMPRLIATNTPLAVQFLRAACVCLAFTSATVVNSLTAYASLQCDEVIDPVTGKTVQEHPELAKGKALGKFRSSGQLGRGMGPLLACAMYWTWGPSLTYGLAGMLMGGLSFHMRGIAKRAST